MGIGPRHGDGAGLQRLPETVENLGMEFGQFIKEQNPAMGQGRLAGAGARAAADHGRHRGGMVGRPEGPPPGQPPALQKPRNGMDHRHVQQFLRRQRRKQTGQAFRHHRLARAGRTHHEQVVMAGGGDFQGPLGPFLSLDLTQIGNLAVIVQLARRRPGQNLRALEMVDQLDQRRRGQDGQIAPGPGRFRPARLRTDQRQAGRIGGHGGGQDTGRGTDAGIGPQLSENQVFGGRLARHDAHLGQDGDRDRQVEMRALLGPVGRSEVHDQALGRQRQARRCKGGPHAFAAFRDRLVAQADHREDRLGARCDLDLYIDNAGFCTVECD